MYTQQFIKSVKKIFFGICMAVLGNKFSKVDYSRQKYRNIHKNKANLVAYSAIG